MSRELLADWARLLVDGLIAAGLRDVVLSPGSRSTPWALALIERPQLRCVDIVDERSAGFYALGQARASGRASLLLCTSGTAPAHYLPAVIEAAACHLPLVVLSADRPFERLDCGAPQVIDQTKLFGDHVRAFFELGMPDASPRAQRAVRARGVMAMARSRWPRPGPVHVNARARKPLEPARTRAGGSVEPGEPGEAVTVPAALRRTGAAPRVFEPESEPSRRGVDELLEAWSRARRPLVVAGPAALDQAAAGARWLELASRTGSPMFADATSQLRFHSARSAGSAALDSLAPDPVADGAAALLASASFRRRYRPDFVLQIGAAPVAGVWEDWLESLPDVYHAVVSGHTWNDPVHTADLMLLGDPARTLDALDLRLRRGAADSRWLPSLLEASRAAATIAGEVAEEGWGEAAAARATVAEVPAGGLLALGNSLPIRWVDLFAPTSPRWLRVWSQRGANGIDGLVSGVAGSTSVLLQENPDCPATVLVLGDLALLHDLGGLATLATLRSSATAAATAARPFVVVVINNDGGRIFEQLPVAALDLGPEVIRHWTTPHGRSFAGVAETFGLTYHAPRQVEELRQALRGGLESSNPTLVEVVVEPGAARSEIESLRNRLDSWFAARPDTTDGR